MISLSSLRCSDAQIKINHVISRIIEIWNDKRPKDSPRLSMALAAIGYMGTRKMDTMFFKGIFRKESRIREACTRKGEPNAIN